MHSRPATYLKTPHAAESRPTHCHGRRLNDRDLGHVRCSERRHLRQSIAVKEDFLQSGTRGSRDVLYATQLRARRYPDLRKAEVGQQPSREILDVSIAVDSEYFQLFQPGGGAVFLQELLDLRDTQVPGTDNAGFVGCFTAW